VILNRFRDSVTYVKWQFIATQLIDLEESVSNQQPIMHEWNEINELHPSFSILTLKTSTKVCSYIAKAAHLYERFGSWKCLQWIKMYVCSWWDLRLMQSLRSMSLMEYAQTVQLESFKVFPQNSRQHTRVWSTLKLSCNICIHTHKKSYVCTSIRAYMHTMFC